MYIYTRNNEDYTPFLYMIKYKILPMDKLNRISLLKEIIKHRFNGNQALFARTIKKSTTQVNAWVLGHKTIGDGSARHIELTLGLPAGYFNQRYRSRMSNVALMQQNANLQEKVPLITYNDACHWHEIFNDFMIENAQEWVHCPVSHSENAFALKVEGESMFNPHEKISFSEGEIIYVDPSKKPTNGCFVVAASKDGIVKLRKYIVDGGTRYIKALNPSWPRPFLEMTDDCRICGVVIYKGMTL